MGEGGCGLLELGGECGFGGEGVGENEDGNSGCIVGLIVDVLDEMVEVLHVANGAWLGISSP